MHYFYYSIMQLRELYVLDLNLSLPQPSVRFAKGYNGNCSNSSLLELFVLKRYLVQLTQESRLRGVNDTAFFALPAFSRISICMITISLKCPKSVTLYKLSLFQTCILGVSEVRSATNPSKLYELYVYSQGVLWRSLWRQ